MSVTCVYAGTVLHHRLAPPQHRFEYPLFMWWLDLDELSSIDGSLAGFGHNRRRPITFRDRDHFAGSDEPARRQVRSLVEGHGLEWPGGPVRVLTHCRVFGYVFNPVSFWYCYRPDETLAVVVAEVNNTSGQRHCYVAGARPAAGRPGARAGVTWFDKKVFHVSPFLSLDGTYAFSLESPGERARVRISLTVGDVATLVTRLSLRREPLSAWTVPRVLVRYPAMTLRVIGRIHWEALRLRRKGASYRPAPPYDPEGARRGVA